MQSLHTALTHREAEEGVLPCEAVQRLDQWALLNEKTKQIQERPEEKGTRNGDIHNP